jgi:hypothetical protein
VAASELCKNGKETAIYKRRNSTQNSTETQNTKHTKQEINIKRILKAIV